jgi:DNA-binding XRE family transcriptional regulator
VDLARQLGESLRRMRQEAGLTHVEMARRLKMNRATYTRLENGGLTTRLATLSHLCRVLRCDIGELFRPGRLRMRS